MRRRGALSGGAVTGKATMVEFDRSAFIAKFQEEAAELLQRLNEGIISLEAEPANRELIDQILRDAHTLKGSSRMVGLIDISDIAHRLEDVMVLVRDGKMTYTDDLSDSFFEALDAIVYLADNKGVNEGDVLDLPGLQARLSAIASAVTGDGDDDVPAPAAEEVEEASTAEPDDSDETPDPASPAGPDSAPSADAEPEDGHKDAPASDESHTRVLHADNELKSKVQTTIRIRTTQLDGLLNLISEVVISQIKSEQRVQEMKAIHAQTDQIWQTWGRIRSALTAACADELLGDAEVEAFGSALGEHRRMVDGFTKSYTDDVSRAGLVINDLQEDGMRMRMLPVNTIFQAFPRAVRDLAKQFRKEIDLQIEGGDTELDKKVLEEINDPLVHIIRNAVDHGIEDPDTREKAGKPRQGTIVLSARQEGDRIVIEISDDGAGIDPERVRASAVRKGYITEAEAAGMSDRKAMYLIFEAGFSTAAIITEISGRGVGMDVVREFVVEKLKGSLDVSSQVGKGTTFRLTIPLTLAIIRALLLRVGDQVFALPTGGIEETLQVNADEIVRVEGREVIRRQMRTYPLARLSEILGVTSDAAEGEGVSIVTIGYSGNRLGFIVDEFVGEQQIVIKPLGDHLKKIDNVAGVTILGAGDVVPILNVPDLMNNARSRTGQRVGPVAREEREGPRRILICEDSFTTRELERSIFEAAGYDVETAVDGAAGLVRLKEGLKVDAVVTDVQMPNMTGFQLTRAIKTDPVLARIPVVIVTSLERDEEKAEGVDAGADAYITKSVFNQDTLLETVEQLVR